MVDCLPGSMKAFSDSCLVVDSLGVAARRELLEEFVQQQLVRTFSEIDAASYPLLSYIYIRYPLRLRLGSGGMRLYIYIFSRS